MATHLVLKWVQVTLIYEYSVKIHANNRYINVVSSMHFLQELRHATAAANVKQ